MINIDVAVVRDARRKPHTSLAAIPHRECFSGSGVSPWVGFCEALASIPYEATHCLVLEDDAVVLPDLLDVVRKAIVSRPKDALYFCACGMQAAKEQDAAVRAVRSWALVSDRCVGTVAVCLPVGMAYRFLQWANGPACVEAMNEYPEMAYAGDTRLWYYLTRVVGVAQCVSTWSIVGHGAPNPDESLVSQRETLGVREAYNPVCGIPGMKTGFSGVRVEQIDWGYHKWNKDSRL